MEKEAIGYQKPITLCNIDVTIIRKSIMNIHLIIKS